MRQRLCSAIVIPTTLAVSSESFSVLTLQIKKPHASKKYAFFIKNKAFRNIVAVTIIAFMAFMVIGRLISGVHWFTDIVGGALFSVGLVMMYYAISSLKLYNFDDDI